MYDKLGDHLGQARVHLDLGLSYEFRERHHDVFGATPARPRKERDANAHDALAHARRALDQFPAVGDHAGQAAAFSAVGRSLALRGLAEEAVGHCERGVQMSYDLGDDRAEAVALISLGYALPKAGRYADAASTCQRAVCLAQKTRILRVEAIALTHLAESHRSSPTMRQDDLPAPGSTWQLRLDSHGFVVVTQQSACQTRESLLLNAKVPYAAVTAGMGRFPGAHPWRSM